MPSWQEPPHEHDHPHPTDGRDHTGVHARPGLGRLVAVELRKMVDTRAGFWMQVATVALTVTVVIVALAVGDATDHTFAAVLDVGVFPAASCFRSPASCS
jgi:hypothetical protein